jgi:hypothetical protein
MLLIVESLLGGCSFCLGFDGNLHLRTRFEAYLVTILSRQGVGNAYLSV